MPKPEFQLEEKEVFDLLVFDTIDGCCRIQTNKKIYLLAGAYFYAAVDLSRLIKGQPTKHLNSGSDYRVDTEDSRKVCIDYDTIQLALDPEAAITSDTKGVVEVLSMLREVHNE